MVCRRKSRAAEHQPLVCQRRGSPLEHHRLGTWEGAAGRWAQHVTPHRDGRQVNAVRNPLRDQVLNDVAGGKGLPDASRDASEERKPYGCAPCSQKRSTNGDKSSDFASGGLLCIAKPENTPQADSNNVDLLGLLSLTDAVDALLQLLAKRPNIPNAQRRHLDQVGAQPLLLEAPLHGDELAGHGEVAVNEDNGGRLHALAYHERTVLLDRNRLSGGHRPWVCGRLCASADTDPSGGACRIHYSVLGTVYERGITPKPSTMR